MPGDLKVSAQIQSLNAELEHVQLKNVDPIRFEIADRVFRLENFHLTGTGTDFTAHGTAQLSEARGLDFHLEGAVNMGLLHTINSKLSTRGTVGLTLDANGTMANPVLQGRLEIKDTFLNHDDFPSGLSDLKGVLLFDRNRIQIESLTGTTGGGAVTLSGSGTYQNGTFLMDFGATAQDVRLRYPPGVSSTANSDLHLTGSSTSAVLSGEVVVTKLSVTPGFDFGSYLEKSKQSVAVAQRDSIGNRLRLDVHVTTTPELQMQNAMAKLSGNGDLRMRGTVDRPVILGRAETLEGEIIFNGAKFHVDRADVTFSNPAKTEAIVDLQASTRVRDYDITVTLNGDVGKPNGLKASWRSEPPLPEADIIALLALGRTQAESAAQQSGGSLGFGGEASNLLINQALNSAVNSRLQRLFGASRIKIDPQGLASATNIIRGPQVTIEQQVASNLTVTYSTNVSVASQQIIQVEYNVSRNVSVVALRDQNGVVSFDIKIRQRKR
jgi:translocation and assembly module TamB